MCEMGDAAQTREMQSRILRRSCSDPLAGGMKAGDVLVREIHQCAIFAIDEGCRAAPKRERRLPNPNPPAIVQFDVKRYEVLFTDHFSQGRIEIIGIDHSSSSTKAT